MFAGFPTIMDNNMRSFSYSVMPLSATKAMKVSLLSSENDSGIDRNIKVRRKRTQKQNVITYQAEHVEGHRNDDIENLVDYIENKEGSGKRRKAGNSKSRRRRQYASDAGSQIQLQDGKNCADQRSSDPEDRQLVNVDTKINLAAKTELELSSSDKSDSGNGSTNSFLQSTSSSLHRSCSESSSSCFSAQASSTDINNSEMTSLLGNMNPGLDSNITTLEVPLEPMEFNIVDDSQQKKSALNCSLQGNHLLQPNVDKESNTMFWNSEEMVTKKIRILKYVQDVENIFKGLSNHEDQAESSLSCQSQNLNSEGETSSSSNSSRVFLKSLPMPQFLPMAINYNTQIEEDIKIGKIYVTTSGVNSTSNSSQNVDEFVKSCKNLIPRPPIIFVDEGKAKGQTFDEFTFGFAKNEQLTINEERKSSMLTLDEVEEVLVKKMPMTVSTSFPIPRIESTANTSGCENKMFSVQMENKTQSNSHKEIKTFIEMAWREVIQDVQTSNGQIEYYNGV